MFHSAEGKDRTEGGKRDRGGKGEKEAKRTLLYVPTPKDSNSKEEKESRIFHELTWCIKDILFLNQKACKLNSRRIHSFLYRDQYSASTEFNAGL